MRSRCYPAPPEQPHRIRSVRRIAAAVANIFNATLTPELTGVLRCRQQIGGKLMRCSRVERREAMGAVMAVLITHMDIPTRQAAVPVKEIARRAGISAFRVCGALRDLTLGGVLRVIGGAHDSEDPFIRRRAARVALRQIAKWIFAAAAVSKMLRHCAAHITGNRQQPTPRMSPMVALATTAAAKWREYRRRHGRPPPPDNSKPTTRSIAQIIRPRT